MFTLNCKGKLMSGHRPLVMGVINTTPDSFYEGSRLTEQSAILRLAEKMIADGADILDLGGQSTRPASESISSEEEKKRVLPAVAIIHDHFPQTVISIDTWYADVAVEAVAAGASMVNDISAGNLDENMLMAVAALRVPYVCMHMKGTPATMQQSAGYDNITLEVLDFLIEKSASCRQAGITDIILDPGFGFGKTIRHNFELLRSLPVFSMLGFPIMIGLSRKSTIYKTLQTTAAGALNGTTVLNTISLLQGADILRVHDVKEAKEVVTLCMGYSG